MASHKNNSILGPAAPEIGWVPTPRYLMRRARILRMLDKLPTGRLLEVGPGAGALVIEASLRGFQCEALEVSGAARGLSEAMITRAARKIPVHGSPNSGWDECFDVLFAFEVLEHIEDDRIALAQWRSWLKPGGHLLLSVPAHKQLWTAGDEWAGHIRRYERRSLLRLLDYVGFEVDEFECYGFPLTNFSERVGAPIYARQISARKLATQNDRQRNNDLSGIDRRSHLKYYPLLSSILGRLALRVCLVIQGVFVRSDFGTGYLVKARRV